LVLDKLKSTFAPEWLNRIEHKVVFKPLSIETLKKIFSIHFVVLQEAWKEKSIIMPHYTELELENLIKEKMYDPQY
jgi:ATP-dependent Clp protease ATP-binding subunit ClpC